MSVQSSSSNLSNRKSTNNWDLLSVNSHVSGNVLSNGLLDAKSVQTAHQSSVQDTVLLDVSWDGAQSNSSKVVQTVAFAFTVVVVVLLPAWEGLVTWPVFVEVSVVFDDSWYVDVLVMWHDSQNWGVGVDWSNAVNLLLMLHMLSVFLFLNDVEGVVVEVLFAFWNDSNPRCWRNLFLAADHNQELERQTTVSTFRQAQPSWEAEDLLGLKQS